MFNLFKKRTQTPNSFFFETKMGIVTMYGEWFHTTAEQIEAFSPGLLENVSLEKLIKEAQAWVRSADSLTLVLLYILLFTVNPWVAAGIALAFHWFWYQYKSGFVVRKLGRVFEIMNTDIVMFIVAFISLSVLGLQQHYTATVIGIVFFFVLKPGFLRKVWNKLNEGRSPEGLLLNDRVLKMVIIKHAMYEGTSPSSVEEMEEKFIDFVLKLKRKKSP